MQKLQWLQKPGGVEYRAKSLTSDGEWVITSGGTTIHPTTGRLNYLLMDAGKSKSGYSDFEEAALACLAAEVFAWENEWPRFYDDESGCYFEHHQDHSVVMVAKDGTRSESALRTNNKEMRSCTRISRLEALSRVSVADALASAECKLVTCDLDADTITIELPDGVTFKNHTIKAGTVTADLSRIIETNDV